VQSCGFVAAAVDDDSPDADSAGLVSLSAHAEAIATPPTTTHAIAQTLPRRLSARYDALIVRTSDMHTIARIDARRRAHRLMIGLMLGACVACKKEPSDEGAGDKRTPAKSATSAPQSVTAQPPIATTTTTAATTQAAARPRYLRKQRPDDARASTSADTARSAFDGDRRTAWIATEPQGKGAWIEARWYSPRTVWSIIADTGISRSIAIGGDLFAQSAHAKRVHLLLGDDELQPRDVGDGERFVAFDVDRGVTRARFVIDDVWPGTSGAPFGITEIALLADATQFPSVPESMVESEVKGASSKHDVARILHRFGVNPTIDRGGTVSLQKASLVDRLERERVLLVSIVGPPDGEGMCNEDDYFVFLATTDDDRLISLGSDSISTKTHEGAPVDVSIRAFHSLDVDDIVATWSSCSAASPTGCHGLRAWTLHRGFPERVVDVLADVEPKLGDDGRAIVIGSALYTFDDKSFTYH
jgi:hypothetical protein